MHHELDVFSGIGITMVHWEIHWASLGTLWISGRDDAPAPAADGGLDEAIDPPYQWRIGEYLWEYPIGDTLFFAFFRHNWRSFDGDVLIFLLPRFATFDYRRVCMPYSQMILKSHDYIDYRDLRRKTGKLYDLRRLMWNNPWAMNHQNSILTVSCWGSWIWMNLNVPSLRVTHRSSLMPQSFWVYPKNRTSLDPGKVKQSVNPKDHGAGTPQAWHSPNRSPFHGQ